MRDWPDGFGRVILDEVDSTMAEAARRAETLTEPEMSRPTWILAKRQSAARGRRGRVWSSPPGSFAASLVIPSSEPMPQLALRSFVAAIALRAALIELGVARSALRHKWPNDVLLRGQKLAGILLETIRAPGAGSTALIIGIGVNLSAAPDTGALEERALAPITLAETGVLVTPEALLDALGPCFAEEEQRFRREGFAATRARWLSAAARRGEVITARLPHQEITGTFEDVDESGCLVLRSAHGRQTIAAADIYF